jgi:hypothetical protein
MGRKNRHQEGDLTQVKDVLSTFCKLMLKEVTKKQQNSTAMTFWDDTTRSCRPPHCNKKREKDKFLFFSSLLLRSIFAPAWPLAAGGIGTGPRSMDEA